MARYRLSRTYLARKIIDLVEHKPWVYRLVRLMCWTFLPLWYRIRITGRENLPDTGPVVIVAKHQSLFDIPLTGMALGPVFPCYVAKHQLFVNKPLRWLISALGGVPLNRDRPETHLSTFRRLRRLIRTNCLVVLYPEGTYVPGQVGPARVGMVDLMLKFQQKSGRLLQFVPLGIRYTKLAWRTAVDLDFGLPRLASGPNESEELTLALSRDLVQLTGLPGPNPGEELC
ncbi:MAG: 1-acyl-sn-glycerol-3-phosphate acyltransferase [Proteobacteria bacterium]|nr:1-acyl-sn-glycerol-3-phosphate acyltransferase [Pseudomonadota bacterium]MBU1741896.1 1-acyl-sn-glycerol-3-phosphate acyltransferase [Pseudomonadota bacterium]